MKNATINEKNINEVMNTGCELSEADLDQVNGGINAVKTFVGIGVTGVGLILIGTGVGAFAGGIVTSTGAGLFADSLFE